MAIMVVLKPGKASCGMEPFRVEFQLFSDIPNFVQEIKHGYVNGLLDL